MKLFFLTLIISISAFAGGPIYPEQLNTGTERSDLDGSIGLRISTKPLGTGLLRSITPVIKVPVCTYNPEDVSLNRFNPDRKIFGNDGRDCSRNGSLRVVKHEGKKVLVTSLETGTPADLACEGEEGMTPELDSEGIKSFGRLSLLSSFEKKLNQVCVDLGGTIVGSKVIKDITTKEKRVENPKVFQSALIRRTCHEISFTVDCRFSHRKDEVLSITEDFLRNNPDHKHAKQFREIIKMVRSLE